MGNVKGKRRSSAGYTVNVVSVNEPSGKAKDKFKSALSAAIKK